MALTATIYNFTIDLSNIDRNCYETLELRVACHPSESPEYLVTRILAYCLEYTEGIAFTQGIAAGDEPAIWVRDLTGAVLAWIEVGLPDADRLHRGSKQAQRTAVYTHRDVTQFVAQLANKKIHKADQLPIYAFDRYFIDDFAKRIDRRTSFSLSVTEGQLYLEIDGTSLSTAIIEHRIG